MELMKLIEDWSGYTPVSGRYSVAERTAFNNLLSNALKFTPPKGKIIIAMNAVNGAIEVSVADTGVGVAPKDMQRIFNKFEQVNASHPVGASGTGLGLPLAKEIVEKHGGSMRVASETGKGSTFTFALPR